MKELVMIWNRIAGRRYSAVNTNPMGINPNDSDDNSNTTATNILNVRRKSSIVVNRFFNVALPIQRNGNAGWSKSEFFFSISSGRGMMNNCEIRSYWLIICSCGFSWDDRIVGNFEIILFSSKILIKFTEPSWVGYWTSIIYFVLVTHNLLCNTFECTIKLASFIQISGHFRRCNV